MWGIVLFLDRELVFSLHFYAPFENLCADKHEPCHKQKFTDGNWHHVAMVLNSAANTAQIFVDGVLEQTNTTATIGSEGFGNNMTLLDFTQYQPSIPVGQGKPNERLVSVNIRTLGSDTPLNISARH